ncbi:MAG: bifunctional 4-hydroxy-3-methylbut-2-enyl diphosphate reductase/30S ribosomal protein S1 [Clostridia bacterium]|nr:bifunctional 4-hydroxy-3-methylbut-2-enyl diphosphate reductase/30S ribosomal protein S1 [Clostridia bacterium]
MSVTVARHAGFCMGVRRAVEIAESTARDAASRGLPCYSLGEVVHNPAVTAYLAELGVRAVDTVGQAQGGVLILRSHGAAPEEYRRCEELGIPWVDCTCARVQALHRLVRQAGEKPVVLVGERDHPEVRATAGWCRGAVYVVYNEADVDALPPLKNALVISQTTMPEEQWDALLPLLRQKIESPEVRQSICAASRVRQQAAKALAAESDVMVVVGGRKSANTRKLYEACARLCAKTILVECAAEIPSHLIDIHTHHIGIAAGASTPDWSLKEVVTVMNDIETKALEPTEPEAPKAEEAVQAEEAPQAPEAAEAPKVNDDADFMASVEASMRRIHPGQTVTGKVLQVTDDEIGVDIGYKMDGIIKRADLVDTDVKVGDDIEVEVVKVNDGDGNVVLSQRNIINRKAWEALMAKFEAGEFVEGVGKEAVKGGLICMVEGVRAFVPASRLSKRYVEKIDQFVGQTMKLKIIDVDQQKKRIVCSRKDVIIEEEASRKAAAWEKIEEGAIITGIVRRFADFGAFVDLGGVDGLIHITDLAWYRVGHPREVLQINQEVQVKVLSVDRERERIQLGYKQLQPQPWDNITEKYPVGLILERKVVRIRPFGAFIELEPGVDGLVHISQVALTRVAKVEDALTVGQDVAVKVLAVDPEAHRISLSIREALEEGAFDYGEGIPEDAAAEEAPVEEAPAEEAPAAEAEAPAEE